MAKRLHIKANGQWLDLLPDFKIKVVLHSQAFPDNWDRSDHSYSISIPKTATNSAVLRYRGEIGVREPNTDVPVEVYQDNFRLFKGLLKVQNMERNYNCFLKLDITELNSTFGEKRLQDYDYEKNIPYQWSDAQVNTQFYPDVPLAHPTFYAYRLFGDRLAPQSDDNWVLNTFGGYNAGHTPDFPSPYLMYVLDQIFIESGYAKPLGDFMEDTELQRLVMMSNRHRPETLTGWQWDAGKHLPDLSVREFIDSLRALFNIGVYFRRGSGQPEIRKNHNVFSSAATIDWTKKVVREMKRDTFPLFGAVRLSFDDDYYQAFADTNIPPGNLTNQYDDQVTVMLQPQLLTRRIIAKSENTVWAVNSGFGWRTTDYNCKVIDPNDYLQFPAVATRSQLPALSWPADENKICLVEDEGWYHITMLNLITNQPEWRLYAWDNGRVEVGQTDNEKWLDLKSRINVPVMDRTGTEISGDILYYLPHIKGFEGISPDTWSTDDPYAGTVQQEPKHWSFMAFYRGEFMHGTGTGFPERLFSSTEWDFDGNQIGNYSLRWNGPNGLLAKFWNSGLEFLAKGRRQIIKVNIDLTDFMALDLGKRYYIHGQSGLIKKIEIEFPLTGPATAEYVA
jgi:hypothetical protein